LWKSFRRSRNLSRIGLKLFGFIAELAIAFIPESRSSYSGFPDIRVNLDFLQLRPMKRDSRADDPL
jgi:hypothetical protein